MGKYSFNQYLILRENTEILVAQFLEDILNKSTILKKNDIQSGNFQSFEKYVHYVWPQDAIQDNLVLPNIFPPDIAGKQVLFKLEFNNHPADTLHKDGKFNGFVINILPFNKAKTIEEIDSYLESLKSTMHHEAEHIYNIGSNYDKNDHEGDEKYKAGMEYMNHPGELKAHARQMAYLYSKNFPNQPFDLEKAQSIINQPTLKNYFGSLSNPETWQKSVEKFGHNHLNPHDKIMSLVPQYLKQYNLM